MVQYVTNENTNLFIVYPTTMKVKYFQGVTSLDSLRMQMEKKEKVLKVFFRRPVVSVLLAKTNRGGVPVHPAKFGVCLIRKRFEPRSNIGFNNLCRGFQSQVVEMSVTSNSPF